MASDFRVIAHRGASAHAPENTLPAFLLALEQGAGEVELDVRFSSDLEIMVFHDDALDRKTDRQGRFSHHDARTLRRVDIGTWFDANRPDVEARFAGTCLATLDEVFEALGDRVLYHIEIKDSNPLLPLRLLQAIDAHGLERRVTITSFSMKPLLAVAKVAPDRPTCLLLRDAHDALRSAEFRPQLEGRSAEEIQDYWIGTAAEAGFAQVAVRAEDVTPRSVARASDRHLSLRGWGVRHEADLLRLLRLGAMGATVDWPGRALEIVRKHANSAVRARRVRRGP